MVQIPRRVLSKLVIPEYLYSFRLNESHIYIETEKLTLIERAQITTSTLGAVNAGNLRINASEFIEISGINSSISSETGDSGNAGNVFINTPILRILDSGQISVNNFVTKTFSILPNGKLIRNILEQPIDGSGNAGTIDITANNITLEDRGGITALSSAGEGGNIQLKVNNLLSLRNNSEISATAGVEGTPGNGGNIKLDSILIVAFPNQNNDITANAFEGNGGNITIFTKGIFGIQERISTLPNNTNDIDASSEFGLNGEVVISNLLDEVNQEIVGLPDNIVEPEILSAQACSTEERVAKGTSRFTITGRGGLPALATDPLNSDQISIGEVETTQNSDRSAEVVSAIPPSNSEIVPARGMIVNEKGEVVLTAYPTSNSSQRIPNNSASCKRT